MERFLDDHIRHGWASYVTVSLSLVGGDNSGVTDGPYYISETYPILMSPSGEEMVIGAGENEVSLPFMPYGDAVRPDAGQLAHRPARLIFCGLRPVSV